MGLEPHDCFALATYKSHGVLRRQGEESHALRLRAFNRLFRGAEINMHLSLSREMISFTDFLHFLANERQLKLAVRLDRGEI